jgi:hypothetical protein
MHIYAFCVASPCTPTVCELHLDLRACLSLGYLRESNWACIFDRSPEVLTCMDEYLVLVVEQCKRL